MEIKNKELHRITVTAIIYREEDGKYLITKRSPHKKAFPNLWTVPGGGMETDDYTNTPKTTKDHWYFAIETTLKREVMEEVNLEIDKVQYLLDMAFIIPDGTPAIILSYYCRYVSGVVKLDKESTEYAWVTYEEAKEYDLIEGILEEIKMVDDILKRGQLNRSTLFKQ